MIQMQNSKSRASEASYTKDMKTVVQGLHLKGKK